MKKIYELFVELDSLKNPHFKRKDTGLEVKVRPTGSPVVIGLDEEKEITPDFFSERYKIERADGYILGQPIKESVGTTNCRGRSVSIPVKFVPIQFYYID